MNDIRIRVTSGRFQDPSVSKQSFSEWKEYMESEDRYIRDIQMDIYETDEDGEEIKSVGYLCGSLFSLDDDMYDSFRFVDLCDCVDESLFNMAKAITDKNGSIEEYICEQYEQILYLDRIYIQPEYRNRGIASYILENMTDLLEFYCNLYPDVSIFEPAPQEQIDGEIGPIECEKEYDLRKKQLVKFYKTFGFNKVKNQEYMFKRHND